MPSNNILSIDVIGTPSEVTPERVEGRSVAVIDVFRATSAITTAMENGTARIIPMVGIDECFDLRYDLKAENPDAKILLGGERGKVLIEGFDLDNSPYSYTPEKVNGATIIMSTTNGTRAIDRSGAASALFIASMLNATAVCRELAALGRDIVLVCSGREDRFSTEDGLCAGLMACILSDFGMGYNLTDFAWVMSRMYINNRDDLKRPLESSLHYNDLMAEGFDVDVAYCLQQDIFKSVPKVNHNGEIVL